MSSIGVAPSPMRVAQVPKAGGAFQIVDREIPKPGPRQVRIKVQACGVCHSDSLTKEGAWPGIRYPRSPGHEVAGVIEKVGADVSEWKEGQRVPGVSHDGGYQEFMVAPVEALAAIPDSLTAAEAAPML